MKKMQFGSLLSLVVLLSLLTSCSEGPEAKKQKELYEQAVALEHEQQFFEAAKTFQKAEAVDPTSKLGMEAAKRAERAMIQNEQVAERHRARVRQQFGSP